MQLNSILQTIPVQFSAQQTINPPQLVINRLCS